MIYGSVCSGVEAATVAWKPLGWKPAFASETEPFPRAVIQYRFPDIPLHGDLTTIEEGDYEPIELIVGGTPCQDFSIAGKRAGLDAPRGNLTLEYFRLVRRLRPRWFVLENVPDLLSSGSARDFGTVLGAVAACGYHVAWRVFDAKDVGVDGFCGAVPQRRSRLYLVGHSGDWRGPAAVLFESEGLLRNHPPRRRKEPELANTVTTCVGAGGAFGRSHAHYVPEVCGAIVSRDRKGVGSTLDDKLVTEITEEVAGTLLHARVSRSPTNMVRGQYVVEQQTLLDVSPTLDASSFRAGPSCDQMIRGKQLIMEKPIVWENHGQDGKVKELPDVGATVTAKYGTGGNNTPYVQNGMRVRKLTPEECERLQGLPTDWTRIPWRGKPPERCPPSPRYEAIGNAFPVNVMRWLGIRIEYVDSILEAT